MLEAGLRFKADNLQAIVATGRVIDDPSPVKAHFRQARERYLRADEQFPGIYRRMQETFLAVSAKLMLAAAPGLAAYTNRTSLNPDLIGQIFLTLLEPGPFWRQFFPPWPEAQAAARRMLPDPERIVIETLHVAVVRRQRAGQPPITLMPGENFEAWFAGLEPYLDPPLIGPAPDSATMLAAAACLPEWAVRWGVVKFSVHTDDLLLAWLASINTMLYGLNGYELELARTIHSLYDAPLPAAELVPDIPSPAAMDPLPFPLLPDRLSFSAQFRGKPVPPG